MKQLALLTMDNLDAFKSSDSLLEEPMAAVNWKSSEVSWRDNQVDWNNFDAVIIRSPGDYQDACEDFLLALEKVEQSAKLIFPWLYRLFIKLSFKFYGHSHFNFASLIVRIEYQSTY
jgi:hypothetical protein